MANIEKKQYFTVSQLMEAATRLAKTDLSYQEAEKVCVLDYELVCSGTKNTVLTKCQFDVIGQLAFGGSEGIYAGINLTGFWDQMSQNEKRNCTLAVYTLKTLKTDKDAYLALGHMMNVICYYANEIVSQNLDRFD